MVGAEKLVGHPCIELRKLVKAFAIVMGAIDVFPKAITLRLVEPTRKISNKTRPRCRQIEYKHQCP